MSLSALFAILSSSAAASISSSPAPLSALPPSFNAEATVVDEAGLTKTHRLDDRKSEITVEGICKTSAMPSLGAALSFTLNATTAYPAGSASVSFVGTITKIDEKGSNKGFTAVTVTAIDYEGITPA